MFDDDTMNEAAKVSGYAPGYAGALGRVGRPTAYPCIDIHGVQVYAYVKGGELVVSLHFDGDTDVWDQQCVPVRIETGAPEPLYVMDQDGNERFGELTERIECLYADWEAFADRIDVQPDPLYGFDSHADAASAESAEQYRECAGQLRLALNGYVRRRSEA